MSKISTLIGLISAVVATIACMLLEGSNPMSFLNLPSLVLIGGGCCAVGITSFSLKEFFQVPKYVSSAIFSKTVDFTELIVTFISLSEKARREGLLILEEEVESMEDEMMRQGMTLVVDGTDPEIVSNVLMDYSESTKNEDKTPSEFFETIGGFSPTLGIIGTVMGLVSVLENLGGDPTRVGSGIAVAFIATFYGISFANLFFLPLANRIKYVNRQNALKRQIMITGILSIQNGDNPHVLKERLLALISDRVVRERITKELKI